MNGIDARLLQLALGVALTAIASAPLHAQSTYNPPPGQTGYGPPPGQGGYGPPPGVGQQVAEPLPQDQLDSLLAPIALYPDQLLTQVLMAATYPLEVTEAAQFVQQNPGLTGNALDQALEQRNWDPSVQSLAAYPQVLVMMNDKLDWTQQLGDAFLANEQQVMDTVQSLRARAQAAGNLQSNEEQRVSFEDQSIIIEPAQPQTIFVPVYNPLVIYGPWWAPAYRPWYWFPPAIYGYRPVYGGGIVWGRGWSIYGNHWGWSRPNWRGRSITINVGRNAFLNRYPGRYQGGNWSHSPDHRRGVAYRSNNVRNQYQKYDRSGIDRRQDYRGNDLRRGPGQNQTQQGRPAPTFGQPGGRPGPSIQQPSTMVRPAINPRTRDTRPQVQMQSDRGQASRLAASRSAQTMGTPMNRQQNVNRAPSGGRPSGSGGGGGGGGGGGRGSGGGGDKRGR